MNTSIMITGANAGIGKETARQLAMISETEKIYLACRNQEKAKAAKAELEAATKRSIFEIILMDVSNPESVRKGVQALASPIDALVLNAGGMGGKYPKQLTEDRVTQVTATNLLGHVVLVDELLKAEKLNHLVVFASSEVARGVKKMGIQPPDLHAYSIEEFASIFDGSKYGEKVSPMQMYAEVKFAGTMWMSSMAREHPTHRFLSISPGSTSGTKGSDDLPFIQRVFLKYIGLPLVMPLLGLAHNLRKGAQRMVEGLSNPHFESGGFYASKANILTGPLIDQGNILPVLNNQTYQDNSNQAIHRFISS